MGPNGEFPNGNDVKDVLDPEAVDDEDEYVPASGPLGGAMPRASLGPTPAGKVDTEEPLPAVIWGLYPGLDCPR